MPNALIAPYVEGSSQQVTLPLRDPRFLDEYRFRYARDAVSELSYANSLFVPGDKWPARGWLLLRRGDLDLLTNKYRTDLQLAIDDFRGGKLVFKNLTLVQARCMSRGLLHDPEALYLTEVTDLRGVVWNPWARFPINQQFNVVAPAYPGSYYNDSLSGGAPYTYDGILNAVWTTMSGILGAYPGLPQDPGEAGEGVILPGESAWLAFNRLLSYIGMQVAVDLTKTSPYSIVIPGADDNNYDITLRSVASQLEDDFEFIDAGSGRVPKEVVVYFHRRNQYYGTEETIRTDSLQWSTRAVHAVTVPAPLAFQNAAGRHFLWSDFTVRYDTDGNPLAEDVTTATSIAESRVTDYYNRIEWGTVGSMRQVYTGAVPFAAGSQVSGARWYMDFQTGELGWRTEIVRNQGPPWPQVDVHEAE